MAHAEFESYIEDRCWDIVSTAIQKWKVDRKERHILMSLLARWGPPVHDRLTLGDCIGKAGNSYFHIIKKNNGIRISQVFVLKIFRVRRGSALLNRHAASLGPLKCQPR